MEDVKVKVRHSEEYLKSFKEVKLDLPKVYLNTEGIKEHLKKFKDFTLSLQYDEFTVMPRFILKDKNFSMDVTDYISLKQKDNFIPIGYKRMDDLLDLNGNKFSRSPKVVKTLEMIRSDNSFIKWLFYKLSLIFKK